MIINYGRSTGLIILGLLSAQLSSAAPTQISNLTALTGNQPGKITLHWSAPSNSPTRYIIKYRVRDPIGTLSEFDQATGIDGPPLNIAIPTPASPGAAESLSITGLSAGSIYGFAIRSADSSGVLSPLSENLSNNTTAQAGDFCGENPKDGLGSAVVEPASMSVGQLVYTTMTFTVSQSSIQTGGKISLRVPDFWTPPQTTRNGDYGFAAFQYPGAATLSLTIEGQVITVTVDSGPLLPDETVKIFYIASTCGSGVSAPFRIHSQYQTCGILKEITNSPRFISTVPGPAQYISFDNFQIPVQINTPTPLYLAARDSCGHEKALASDQDVNLWAAKWSGGNFSTDTVSAMSLTSNMASPFTYKTVTIPSGAARTTIYYQIDSASLSPNNYIQLQFQQFQPPFLPVTYFASVLPVTSGIANSSVDTGTVGSSKLARFTPDNDRVDDTVFIRATLPTSLGWRVEISSDSFNTIFRTVYGFGNSINVGWEGYGEGSPGIPPGIAPPATYQVRIRVTGDTLTADTSLSIELASLGISGRVVSSTDSAVGIADAEISVYGPSQRFTRSKPDGTFQVNGLKSGTYNVQARKIGYSNSEKSHVLVSGIGNAGNIEMEKSSILRLTVKRPSTGNLPEIWGNVNAHTTNWAKQAHATVHFKEGHTTADAGDSWNTTPTPYIDLSFVPGSAFILHYDVPGHGLPDENFTALAVDEVRTATHTLTRQPDISGQIFIPSPSTEGTWISVEAKRSNNQKIRFYGGAYIPAGNTTSYYRINGVSTGTYTLRTYAPGYISASTAVTVAPGVDVTSPEGDFPPLSQGGSVSGSITLNGDSTALGNNGFTQVSVSARSRVSPDSSYATVTMATHTTQSVSSYSLKGFADGTYDIFANVEGFTLVPGPKTVTISGGVGTFNFIFERNSGSLTGTVSIPASDFTNVTVEILPFNSGFSMGGPNGTSNTTRTTTPDGSGTYSFNFIGSGFYSVRASYRTTGFTTEQTVQIANGVASTLNLDLRGNTYSISGTVTTEAPSPFNSLDYYVNLTTATDFFTTNGSTSIPAHHIEAQKADGRNFYSGGQDNYLDFRRTFFAVVDEDGHYSFNNLPPGTYILVNNGEMDNNNENGTELAEETKIITIKDSNVPNVDFILKDGFDVSGTLTVDSGIADTGRNVSVYLTDSSHNRVVEKTVFLTGTSVSFTLSHVPAGTYVLSASDFDSPRKYWADSLTVELVSVDATGKELRLSSIGKIQGQLRIKNGELITSTNRDQLLSSSFGIFARANPFIPNGYASAEYPLIGPDNTFTIYAGEGTYDLNFQTDFQGGEAELARGIKPMARLTVSGISVLAGQTKDIGTIELTAGESVKGSVTDLNNIALVNVRVTAEDRTSGNHDVIESYTDSQGKYILNGLDPKKKYDIIASPYPDPFDQRFNVASANTKYAESRKANVTPGPSSTVDFKLKIAQGILQGTVKTPDSGELIIPFSEGSSIKDLPGAIIMINKKGVIPSDNPIGEIEVKTDADGTFLITGLSDGDIYNLTFMAKGYGSASLKNVLVPAGTKDLGEIELVAGAKMYGKIYDQNGKAPSQSVVDTLVAVSNGFSDIVIAQTDVDASGSVTGYELAGFKSSTTYTVLAFNQDSDVISFGNFVVNQTVEKNLTVQDTTPTILPIVNKADGIINVRFDFTVALDKSEADTDGDGTADSDQFDRIITKVSGNGTLSHEDDWLSEDRKSASISFTSSDNAAFTLRVDVTYNKVKSSNGEKYTDTTDFTFYPGLGDEVTTRLANGTGGNVELNTSEFSGPAGIFGDDSETVVEVKFRSADTIGDIPSAAPGVSALSISETLGLKAYPSEMAAAMRQVRSLEVTPFSSFYDIFLPAGVNHFFPQGKEARLCLTYDEDATDPSSLNIYYYHPASNEYLLENRNKTVDTENTRICVDIAHASVFTVLNSTNSIISGGAYNGELTLINFPNPFNLKTKTVTLQDPGSAAASQNIEGTMIKMSIPSSMSGDVEVKIFNVAGELVRTLHHTVTGGSHYYIEWDGKNEHGQKVASGTYIGRFTVGGANEKFFKMAVLK